MALVKPDSARIAKIAVIGVGGGGGNAVSSMLDTESILGVEFVALNTDAQVLLANKAPTKIQIGEKLTKGLGVGGNPDIGEQAAEESIEKIKELVASAEADVSKFDEKGNKAAGTRVRQAMQELKKLAQEVRTEVQEAKNTA